MQIKDATLRYKLYEAAIESGINTSQYHLLINEGGVLDWVKSALAGVTAGKEMTGDLKNMFANKKNQVLYRQATETIKNTVKDLFKAGAAAGVDKDALRDWLVKGIESVTRDAAESAPAADKKLSQAPVETGKPGTIISPDNPESTVSALVAAAAADSGQDAAKAKEQAVEKNIDVPKASKILANSIAKSSGADSELSYKVINWLLKNNHMVSENGGPVGKNDLLKEANRVLQSSTTKTKKIMVERWSKLAGLLCEEDKNKLEKTKKFGDLLDDLQKALNIKDEDAESLMNILIALDDLDTIEIKK